MARAYEQRSKDGEVAKTMGRPDQRQLALIHRFSKKTLEEEEVYVFPVRLCDNQVDRDGERFDKTALHTLARLFVGVTGIFDHNWSAKTQTARIFEAQVEEEPDRLTCAGEPYGALKGWAYMLRNEENKILIDEIEAGIKKEVSIGCSVRHRICSICGADTKEKPCSHQPGQRYRAAGGKEKLCYFDLTEPTDVYEWSFVAVPAQKAAGVTKRLSYPEWTPSPEEKTLEAAVKRFAGSGTAGENLLREYRELKAQAEFGLRCEEQMLEEIARLGMLAEKGWKKDALTAILRKLSPDELLEIKKRYEDSLDHMLPPVLQLARYESENKKPDQKMAQEFMI